MLEPRVLVFSSLFPSQAQPAAGLFIKERMFRVGQHFPLIVVSPKPWFPLQGLIRKFRPHFRPSVSSVDNQQGITVYQPRFFCVPGVFKFLDGYFMALSCFLLMKKLKKQFEFNVIDSHFAFPDGKAATLLGSWLNVPVTITLRGTEIPHAKSQLKKRMLVSALKNADKIFSVSTSLKQHANDLGIAESKIQVVGNGVDIQKFYPVDSTLLRQQLGISAEAKVLITVGGLVERKGFHRVMQILPQLQNEFSDVHYLIVGGASAEGNMEPQLRQLGKQLGLGKKVHFLGTMNAQQLKGPLSASDLFVLSTRNEGWANVLLESLACGVPVVASDVGGNAEVICNEQLGRIVPFDGQDALYQAVKESLAKSWDKASLLGYAEKNSWDSRVAVLRHEFNNIVNA